MLALMRAVQVCRARLCVLVDTKDEARAALKGLPARTATKITNDATATANKVKAVLRDMTALRAGEHDQLFNYVRDVYVAFGSPDVHSVRLKPESIIQAMQGMLLVRMLHDFSPFLRVLKC